MSVLQPHDIGLLSLSDEVLVEICSHLTGGELLSVFNTCSRLRRLARDKKLVRKISFRNDFTVRVESVKEYFSGSCVDVKCLNMNGVYWIQPNIITSLIMKMTSLEELHVGDVFFTAKQFSQILTKLRGLTKLSFTWTWCQDKDIQVLLSPELRASYERLETVHVFLATGDQSPLKSVTRVLTQCRSLVHLVILTEDNYKAYDSAPPPSPEQLLLSLNNLQHVVIHTRIMPWQLVDIYKSAVLRNKETRKTCYYKRVSGSLKTKQHRTFLRGDASSLADNILDLYTSGAEEAKLSILYEDSIFDLKSDHVVLSSIFGEDMKYFEIVSSFKYESQTFLQRMNLDVSPAENFFRAVQNTKSLKLTEIVIPQSLFVIKQSDDDLDEETVEEFKKFLDKAKQLSSIELYNKNQNFHQECSSLLESLTNCERLENLSMSRMKISKKSVFTKMFSSCTMLTSIHLIHMSSDQIISFFTDLEKGLSAAKSLKVFHIIHPHLTDYSERLFNSMKKHCINLEKIVMIDSLTSSLIQKYPVQSLLEIISLEKLQFLFICSRLMTNLQIQELKRKTKEATRERPYFIGKFLNKKSTVEDISNLPMHLQSIINRYLPYYSQFMEDSNIKLSDYF